METISTAALSLRDAFERDGVSPVEINMGPCADFAAALSQDLAEQGISVEITGTP
jgi:cell division ATPase FtsA